ncbi:MAG: hypothetical protein HC866_27170 [Leptolyngbyaceae cyanobacterium RU_5_1]|nr:hypothetical protein [Leptolyngbyaceae cyanobacterium RU_5_1]
MTNKHFVLTIDPTHTWDKLALRDPLNHEQADLAKLAAVAVGSHPGRYLIAVSVQVSIVEAVPQPEPAETDQTVETIPSAA